MRRAHIRVLPVGRHIENRFDLIFLFAVAPLFEKIAIYTLRIGRGGWDDRRRARPEYEKINWERNFKYIGYLQNYAYLLI